MGKGGGEEGRTQVGAPPSPPDLPHSQQAGGGPAGWTLRVTGRGAQASPLTAACLEEVFAALSQAVGSGVTISSGQGLPGLPVDPQDGPCPPFSWIRSSLGQDSTVVLGWCRDLLRSSGRGVTLQTGLQVGALAQGRLCPGGACQAGGEGGDRCSGPGRRQAKPHVLSDALGTA